MLNLDALKQFQENHYARHLVFKSDNVEILVVCWRPGQHSPVHDHGKSDGLMIILEGEITNTTYHANGEQITTVWRAGDVGHTPIGASHEVANRSQENVVSLHIYSPPLRKELQGADIGYHNEVMPQEVKVSDDVFRYYMGLAAPHMSCQPAPTRAEMDEAGQA